MNKKRLSVQVVTWNSAEVLPGLMRSLQKQTFADFRLMVIDNASEDQSTEVVQKAFPDATIILNTENKGFCAAHNLGIRMTETDFIALVNPDVMLMPDALSLLMRQLDTNPTLGSTGGKLIRKEKEKPTIDSAGLIARPTRQFLNRGEGEGDDGQYDETEYVFGLTGAFVMFRRSALESIRIGSEYLDEDLFAYKDDVDIAWRLLHAGWKNLYYPKAIGIHSRTVRHENEYSIRSRRVRKHPTINRLSYRNHLLMLMKNEDVRNFFIPLPRLFFYELAKLAYLVLFERSTLPGLFEAFGLFSKMLRKRRITLGQRKRSPDSMKTFFRA